MLSALKKGDRVVTVGGVHGTIQTVKDGSVLLKVDDNVKIEFSRSAISSVISVAKEAKDEKPAPQIEGRKKGGAKKRDEAAKDAGAADADGAVADTEGAEAESGD
jgi:preprotein translocase subunit YajC